MSFRALATLFAGRLMRILLGYVVQCFQEPIHFRRGLFLSEAVTLLHASDQHIPLSCDDLHIVISQMPPFLPHLSLVLLPFPFQLFDIHFVFPLCDRLRTHTPQDLILIAAFAYPQLVLAMRLPAPQPIPKLSLQTYLRRGDAQFAATRLRCHHVILPC